VQKCAKMANVLTSGLNYWVTVEDNGYIQRGVLQALNLISNRVTFTLIVPGATPYGGVKCNGGRRKLRFPTNISL